MKENDDEIFKYLKPLDNVLFSSFNKDDLGDLLIILNKYFLEYINSLGFSKDITFGLELECEDIFSYDLIKDEFRDRKFLKDWIVTYDVSLLSGCEVKTPIMEDKKINWTRLKRVCSILNEYGKICSNCGWHVHVGAQVLGDNRESWLNFIKLWTSYEDIIFRFGYGEYLTHREAIKTYSRLLSYKLKNHFDKISNKRTISLINHYITQEIADDRKTHSVNFKNVFAPGEFWKRNTIEFRCPNGTLNPIIWQNNVNLFVNMLLYSQSSDFNEKIVSRRFNEITKENVRLELYKLINLDKAIELSDLIFKNNLDKVYFLRQYLKDFEIGSESLEMAKPFTRRLK